MPDTGPGVAAVVAELRAAGCVFAEDEARLLREAASTAAGLEALVARRVVGHPLEQILGWAQFRGMQIALDPGVFVPRRRTELLVSLVVERTPPGAVVVDLCCGSGAIGAAVSVELAGAAVYAVDVDPVAVACARRNLAAVRGDTPGQVLWGDLYAPLPAALRGRVDVVVCCAPYVPTDAMPLMPPEARLHEPPSALDGGSDGLDVIRRVVAGAPGWLDPRGLLVLEAGMDQAPLVAGCFEEAGMVCEVVTDQERGATAVVGGLLSGSVPRP